MVLRGKSARACCQAYSREDASDQRQETGRKANGVLWGPEQKPKLARPQQVISYRQQYCCQQQDEMSVDNRRVSGTRQQAHTSSPIRTPPRHLPEFNGRFSLSSSRFKSPFSAFSLLPLYFYPHTISSPFCHSASPATGYLKLFPP